MSDDRFRAGVQAALDTMTAYITAEEDSGDEPAYWMGARAVRHQVWKMLNREPAEWHGKE